MLQYHEVQTSKEEFGFDTVEREYRNCSKGADEPTVILFSSFLWEKILNKLSNPPSNKTKFHNALCVEVETQESSIIFILNTKVVTKNKYNKDTPESFYNCKLIVN